MAYMNDERQRPTPRPGIGAAPMGQGGDMRQRLMQMMLQRGRQSAQPGMGPAMGAMGGLPGANPMSQFLGRAMQGMGQQGMQGIPPQILQALMQRRMMQQQPGMGMM